MKRSVLAVFIVLLVAARSVCGDGIGFKWGRVTGHTTTVITLTKEQEAILDAKPKKKEESVLRSIALTPEQKKRLQKEAGFAPDKMEVWPLYDIKRTCTCGLLNIGIRFKSKKLEVPHFLLGKDTDDRLKSKEDRDRVNSEQPPATYLLKAALSAKC